MTPPGAVAITFRKKVATIPDTDMSRKVTITLNTDINRKQRWRE